MRGDKYIFNGSQVDNTNESYDFSDPQDFTQYCQLIKDGHASERHHDEFYWRLIWHFVERVGSDTSPDKWAMKALADAFMKVLMGGRWEDEFPLPWTKVSLPWSRADWSALGIYCTIANAKKDDPKLKVTDAIKAAAEDHSVSYETARAAYYKHKRQFSKNSPKT